MHGVPVVRMQLGSPAAAAPSSGISGSSGFRSSRSRRFGRSGRAFGKSRHQVFTSTEPRGRHANHGARPRVHPGSADFIALCIEDQVVGSDVAFGERYIDALHTVIGLLRAQQHPGLARADAAKGCREFDVLVSTIQHQPPAAFTLRSTGDLAVLCPPVCLAKRVPSCQRRPFERYVGNEVLVCRENHRGNCENQRQAAYEEPFLGHDRYPIFKVSYANIVYYTISLAQILVVVQWRLRSIQ